MGHDAIIGGGCSGTTPDHIHQGAEGVAPLAPRTVPERLVALRLSGLGPLEVAS